MCMTALRFNRYKCKRGLTHPLKHIKPKALRMMMITTAPIATTLMLVLFLRRSASRAVSAGCVDWPSVSSTTRSEALARAPAVNHGLILIQYAIQVCVLVKHSLKSIQKRVMLYYVCWCSKWLYFPSNRIRVQFSTQTLSETLAFELLNVNG